MKTPMTPANLAIKALADSIVSTLDAMQANAVQGQEHAETGDINGVVGALMATESRVAALKAQLDAVLALHRLNR